MDDITVIERCIDGDREVYEMLVKKYENPVFSLVRTVVTEREDALDIVQDSFVTAFIKLDKFDKDKNFKPWIMSIAFNKSIDHLRRRKYFIKHLDMVRNEKRTKQSQNKKNTKIQDSEIFGPYLKNLSSKEKSALVMQLNLDMKAAEIGEVMNCSENTVRVHLFNARSKLKKLLELSKELKI